MEWTEGGIINFPQENTSYWHDFMNGVSYDGIKTNMHVPVKNKSLSLLIKYTKLSVAWHLKWVKLPRWTDA